MRHLLNFKTVSVHPGQEGRRPIRSQKPEKGAERSTAVCFSPAGGFHSVSEARAAAAAQIKSFI